MEDDEENEETSLDIIIKSRLHLIVNKIKNLKKEAEVFCKEGSDDKEEVQKAQICASKLENMIKRFTSELNEYFRISNNPSPDEISDMSSVQLDSEEVLAELKCRVSILTDKNKGDKLQSQAFSAKLPTLTLPVFRGDVLAWCGFWDIYKSNIHDRNIPDVDKLLYLKSTLQEEPRRIIDGLETTNKNYAVAIKILTDRYGKQSQIIDAHYSALSNVKAADTSIGECRTTLKEVELPRFMGLTAKAVELHVFSDASKNAYAAVVYLKTENGSTAFVIAKSKVVPQNERKDLHMPRLELLGCYLGSKLINYVKNVTDITIKKEYLWSDSKIVLSWVHSNKLLTPFIARRVNTIKENKQLELRYVNTDLNPADLATRPDLWEKKKTLWLNGPDFLKQEKELWPEQEEFPTHSGLVSEPSSGQGPSEIVLAEVHTPETRMEVDEVKSPETNSDPEKSTSNDKIRQLQKEYFPDEVSGKETNLTRNLGLFLDVDGIVRCKGRMSNTSWTYDKKHPILIPRRCPFTNDIVRNTHESNYHVGASHTLSIIRQNYWIPKGKSYVQQLLAKCPECVKQSGGPFKLPSAPALPFERVNYSSLFTYTGVDYMGPLLINNGDGVRKRWICLFTCLVVRAVHLEVVQDLTAEEGLLALRRMISTRGIPALVTSDNAQHFKLIAEITSNQYCTDKKIQWRFIIPLSPWAGGFYERLIGIVKNCMKRTLAKHMLKDNQLTTIVKEIEAVVNSRPLTSVDSELDHILKPSDFLTMGKVITLEENENGSEMHSISTTKTELIKGWKRALVSLKEFKDMFSNRYLLSLRERYNHLPREPRVTSKLTPSPGQIVQIKGDSKNRNDWMVGKIINLILSADGLCRAAKVKVGKSEYTRSIAHLYPLEIEDSKNPITNVCKKTDNHPLVAADDEIVEAENLEVTHLKIPDTITDDIPLPQLFTPAPSTIDHRKDLHAENENDAPTEIDDEPLPCTTEINCDDINQRSKRAAAIKATERIKEWTRDLTALLLHSRSLAPASVAAGANL